MGIRCLNPGAHGGCVLPCRVLVRARFPNGYPQLTGHYLSVRRAIVSGRGPFFPGFVVAVLARACLFFKSGAALDPSRV
ncbi:hypothetical protein, partial [Escherichia coli]|uniref:hypothetical protein n=1 Tax=Escherichia coli TaxID=562 RepID=UPI001BC8A91A